jgi:hypothetical protein
VTRTPALAVGTVAPVSAKPHRPVAWLASVPDRLRHPSPECEGATVISRPDGTSPAAAAHWRFNMHTYPVGKRQEATVLDDQTRLLDSPSKPFP